MRVLVLADEVFASRERVMMSRLEVGLADEGIRVVHAVPENASSATPVELFSQTVTYNAEPLPFGDRLRARRLAQELDAIAGDAPQPLDLIHVFGGSCWGLAHLLASRTGAAVALEVWRVGLAPRAGHAPWARARDAVFLAPDPAIERALRNAGAPTIRTAPWGVHVATVCRRIFAEDRLPGIMVIGGGRDSAAMHSVLEALAAARRAGAEFIAFFDARAARRAGVWTVAERLGLLDRLSLIDELEGRRDLLLQGDVLIHPEHAGEQRSILLDAMGSGMVVLAAADPNVSILQEGRTCRVVRGSTAAAWTEALSSTLDDREASRRLARGAWEFVRDERPAARYVQAVLDTYAWLTARSSLPFGAAR